MKSNDDGFTLIELSIVLVIIGLIIGGVMVGKDLIRVAEIRATVTQIEKLNAAIYVFKGKYGYLPGDIPSVTAGALGLFQLNTSLGAGFGDGNGLIDTGGNPNPIYALGEVFVFWRHLSEANLIAGTYGIMGNSAIDPSTSIPIADVSNVNQSLLEAYIGSRNYFFVFSTVASVADLTEGGINYIQLMNIPVIYNYTTYASYNSVSPKTLSPGDAYAIDTKLDDGMPNTGVVMARANIPNYNAGNGCLKSIDPIALDNTYNVAISSGGTRPCSLRFRLN